MRRRQLRKKHVFAGIASLLAATAALAHSASSLTERINPTFAGEVWPGNDTAWARAATYEMAKIKNIESMLVTGQREVDEADDLALGRMRYYALKSASISPVQEEALRNLAYVALIEGDGVKSEQIARAAYDVSRRDTGAQMLLVLRLLAREDLAPALSHIDEALRTSSGVREPLYGALAQALQHSEIETLFRPYVRADNEWLADFLVFALENRLETRTIGELIVEADSLPKRPGTSIRELAPSYLVAEGEVDLAYEIASQLASSLAPAEGGGITDPNFNENRRVAPFGWSFVEEDDLSILYPRGGAPMQITSALPFPGEVARQLLALPSGRYRFKFWGELGDNADWTMRCASSDRRLFDEVETGSVTFLVPGDNCEGQWLVLNGKALGPLDVKLVRAEIVRLR